MQNIYYKVFVNSKNCRIFAPAIEANKKAQKHKTNWSIRLSVRTPGFHPGKRGSTPLWTTKQEI